MNLAYLGVLIMFTRQHLTNCREWLENENKYNFPNKSAILSIYYKQMTAVYTCTALYHLLS
nr:MAG TPA: hypothetical protein [Caudoviricetes sp.]